MNALRVAELSKLQQNYEPLEIVERKGIGHPDTICDSVMNKISIALSQEYIKRFGTVLHHNVDKSLLAAGETKPAFGGGDVFTPMKFVFGDRATFRVGEEEIPVNTIAQRAAVEWIKKNLIHVDPAVHVQYQSEIKSGSLALQDIFDRKDKILGANDTSASVGYAPLSRLENLVLALEKHLRWLATQELEFVGDDIKIMAVRNLIKIDITIAVAIVDKYIKSEKEYFQAIELIFDAASEFCEIYLEGLYDVHIDVNCLDVRGRDIDGLYMTVTGTSAEAGDSGQVGRGNNVMGVIPLNRPMSAEAFAGKNPVSHVGKIYNFMSYEIAEQIVETVEGADEAYVWIVSKIGRPINTPHTISTQVILKKGYDVKDMCRNIDEICSEYFNNIQTYTKLLSKEDFLCS